MVTATYLGKADKSVGQTCCACSQRITRLAERRISPIFASPWPALELRQPAPCSTQYRYAAGL